MASQKSANGKTTLYTQETVDGKARVLTTYVNRAEKHVICFTTSVGCQVACQFCYAGPFVTSISAGELFQQVYLVHQDQGLQALTSRRGAEDKPVLFSSMGEGEPLATPTGFKAVVDALQTMGSAFARARLALSTTGINPKMIRNLASQKFPVEFTLNVSLVSARDDVRKTLMGATAPIEEIRGAVGYYQDVTQSGVEWNLVLLDGVNDSDEDAYGVINLLGSGARVRLSEYDPVAGRQFAPSPRVTSFALLLSRYGLRTETHQPDGWDVGAACGRFKAEMVSLTELG